jgi:pilus assembly protein CpaE
MREFYAYEAEMKRLLIVEDESIYQKMVFHAVEPLEFEIEVVDSGEKAEAAANRRTPNLIITDVLMPGMNGYELIRRLRRNSRFANTPVLILTGQSELSDKLEAFEAGADDFMTKPFEPAELLARISVLLRRSEALSELQQQSSELLKPKAQVLAVHSLRGGVGCSSLAINLGIALAKTRSKTALLVDMVLIAGQIALMLNQPLKRTWADIAHVSPEELDWDAIQTIIGKHDSGVHLIAAPTYPSEAELLTPQLFDKAFHILRANFDYLVVDLPHDFSIPSLYVLDVADWIVALMAPELASVRAVAAALDTYRKLEYSPEKIKLVLNWMFERKGIRRKNIEMALKWPIELVIPYTQDLFVEAINHGKPLVYDKPDDRVSEMLVGFARSLAGQAQTAQ